VIERRADEEHPANKIEIVEKPKRMSKFKAAMMG
jgi:hypothetical protein